MKQSIYQNGYGKIAKSVMRDKNLTADAKAIYAYLCSFSGDKDTCYPPEKMITSELVMSKNRFYKHLKLLVKYEYITITKHRKKGVYKNNVYTINKENQPRIGFEDMEKPYMDNEYTNKNIINNNIANNNIVFKEEEIINSLKEKVNRNYILSPEEIDILYYHSINNNKYKELINEFYES